MNPLSPSHLSVFYCRVPKVQSSLIQKAIYPGDSYIYLNTDDMAESRTFKRLEKACESDFIAEKLHSRIHSQVAIIISDILIVFL